MWLSSFMFVSNWEIIEYIWLDLFVSSAIYHLYYQENEQKHQLKQQNKPKLNSEMVIHLFFPKSSIFMI